MIAKSHIALLPVPPLQGAWKGFGVEGALAMKIVGKDSMFASMILANPVYAS